MAYLTKIKAGGIHSLTDARYFASKLVDWAGLVLDPNASHHLSKEEAAAVIGYLSGPAMVGEFGKQTVEEIKALIEGLDLDLIEVGDHLSPEELVGFTQPLMLRITVSPFDDATAVEEKMNAYAGVVAFYLLDMETGGFDWAQLQQGQPFPITDLNRWCQQWDILIALPLEQADLGAFLGAIQPFGLQIPAGEEIKTGVRDFEQVDSLFERLEA